MNIHPQFFNSEQEFVSAVVNEWELENPRPERDIPPQPKIPDTDMIVLNGGFIVAEVWNNARIQLTIKGRNPVTVALDYTSAQELVDMLLTMVTDAEELHRWNCEYNPIVNQHNRDVSTWQKKRDEVFTDARLSYKSHKIAENGKFGGNHG